MRFVGGPLDGQYTAIPEDEKTVLVACLGESAFWINHPDNQIHIQYGQYVRNIELNQFEWMGWKE